MLKCNFLRKRRYDYVLKKRKLSLYNRLSVKEWLALVKATLEKEGIRND